MFERKYIFNSFVIILVALFTMNDSSLMAADNLDDSLIENIPKIELKRPYDLANSKELQIKGGDIRFIHIAFDDYAKSSQIKKIKHYKFLLKEERDVVLVRIQIDSSAYEEENRNNKNEMFIFHGGDADYEIDKMTGDIKYVQLYK